MNKLFSLRERPRSVESSRSLNVAMYTPSAMGGHARYSQELLSALAEVGERRGVRPSLVTSVDLAEEHRSSAYPIHTILPRLALRKEFSGTLQWAGSRLTHYPRRERCLLHWATAQPGLDLIHFQEHTPWLASRVVRKLRARGIAVVDTVHNIYKHCYQNRLHRLAMVRIERAAWRACDALIVHTEGLRDELSRFLGPGHPPIGVAPHGVWSVPDDAGVPGHVPTDGPLLFFGIIRPNKGLHFLIEALAHLPECQLVVAGWPESASYLREIKESVARVAPERVEIIDRFVTEREAAELFERSRLVVLPYTSFAAQSGVLHQAMAHGRPVVVSDVGALGESVREWGIGEVTVPGDAQALASSIQRALDPARFQAMAAATIRVREELSWTRTAERTIDVYDAILRPAAS